VRPHSTGVDRDLRARFDDAEPVVADSRVTALAKLSNRYLAGETTSCEEFPYCNRVHRRGSRAHFVLNNYQNAAVLSTPVDEDNAGF
jgi:hypothetical protein